MCPEFDRPSKDDSGTDSRPVGFGRLSYDPLNKTYWYYGMGICYDQGGSYIGRTNVGSKSIEDLCNIVKYQITQIAETLHTEAMEKINGKAEG